MKTGRLLTSEWKLYVPLQFLSLYVLWSGWPDSAAICIRKGSEKVFNQLNASIDHWTFFSSYDKETIICLGTRLWFTSEITKEWKSLRVTQKPNFNFIPILISILIFWGAMFLGPDLIWANNSDSFLSISSIASSIAVLTWFCKYWVFLVTSSSYSVIVRTSQSTGRLCGAFNPSQLFS